MTLSTFKMRLLIVGLALALVAGAAYAATRPRSGEPASPGLADTPTPPKSQPIRAKGTIVPVRQTKLAFRSTGRVKTVEVRPGDAIEIGQVLATLDARELELALKRAQDDLDLSEVALEEAARSATPEELAAAEAAYAASEAHYQELARGSAPADVVAAESTLTTARQQLAQAEAAAAADERIARANLESTRVRLEQTRAGPRAEDLRAAELQVEQAKASLWSAQTSRDGICGSAGVREYQCDSANAGVSVAETALAVAQNGLARQRAGPTKEVIATAQAAHEQAQAQVDLLLATREQKLAGARSAVAAAEAKLERVRSGTTDSDLKAGQSGLAQARAVLAAKRDGSGTALRTARIRVSQAETTLAQAALALEGARLVAPYDGTVAAVLIAEHDDASPGAPAIVFANLAELQVETDDLDQGSVGKLTVGQPVKVTLDAFDDKTLRGKLRQVAPLGTAGDAGDVTYAGVVALEEQSPEIRWGMTVRLEFLEP